jgi:hypothetical protein
MEQNSLQSKPFLRDETLFKKLNPPKKDMLLEQECKLCE